MGDVSQFRFVQAHAGRLAGPFLEIGSRDYGNTQPLRALFPGADYLGVDMLDGPGVDRVADLTGSFEAVDELLGGRRFGTILSMSVLEHCEDPFRMAENMTRLLAPGGRIVLSVPFAWDFHGYPSDYWRFTAEGVKKLFPRIAWEDEDSRWHSTVPGESRRIDGDIGMLYLRGRNLRRTATGPRRFELAIARGLARLGFLRWLFRRSRLMTPTMIDMVGTVRETG
jgi:SAM-dependent methyltransferase